MSYAAVSSGPLVSTTYYSNRNPYQSTSNVRSSRNVPSGTKKVMMLVVLGATVFFFVSACLIATSLILAFYTFAVKGGTFTRADTRLYPISSLFCDSLELYVDSDSASPDDALGATVYITDTSPPLTINASFTFTYNYNAIDVGYQNSWEIYLYPNSNISIQSCAKVHFPSGITLYIIKGTKYFNSWRSDPSKDGWDEIHASVDSVCNTMSKLDYQVQDEDVYYVVIYCSMQSDSCKGEMVLSVDRYEYDPSFVSSSASCFTNYYQMPCDVDIPFASNYSQALVVTQLASPESNFEQIHQADIQLTCNPRVPFYLTMTLSPMVILAFVLMVTLVVSVSCWRRRRVGQKQYPPLLSANRRTISLARSEEHTPPPYNPEYHTN